MFTVRAFKNFLAARGIRATIYVRKGTGRPQVMVKVPNDKMAEMAEIAKSQPVEVVKMKTLPCWSNRINSVKIKPWK